MVRSQGILVIRMCLALDRRDQELSCVKRQLPVIELRVPRVPLIWNQPFSEIRPYYNNRKPLTVDVVDFIMSRRPSVKDKRASLKPRLLRTYQW